MLTNGKWLIGLTHPGGTIPFRRPADYPGTRGIGGLLVGV
jgi:hypothetical protein